MKFAYLILAHDNIEQLKVLLQVLDYVENDIYLHTDKKNKELCAEDFSKYVCKARLYVYKKYNVCWGDVSQTRCQMFLLSEALKSHHDYYHLISGKDLPIKPHEKIVEFFKENYGMEFVFFEEKYPCRKESCTKFHFFYTYSRKYKRDKIIQVISVCDTIALKLQRIMKINRRFYCGDNWYSITEGLARDFSKHTSKMLKKIRFTNNSDELILQTFLYEKTDKYKLYYDGFDGNHISNVRNIDWKRGNPYVWRESDYEELIKSPHMYARKFDENIDNNIIKKIVQYIST